MRLTQTAVQVPLFVPVLALVAMLGIFAIGFRAMAPSRPAVVAYIDISRVFENLAELADHQNRFNQRLQNISTRDEQFRAQLRQIEEEMEGLAATSEAYQNMLVRFEEIAINRDVFLRVQERTANRDIVLILSNTYQKVRREVAAYAQANGIDLVIFNDSVLPFEAQSKPEVDQQIAARRVIYAADHMNITDEIIVLMNNKHHAGR